MAAMACTRVSGVLPDLEMTTKRVVARSRLDKRPLERAGIEIIVEAGARAVALPAIAVVAGNAPAAELRERLAAEA